MMEGNFAPGCCVFVVERDGCNFPVDISGYMFITHVKEYAILSAYINDLETIEETLDYHEAECRENYDTRLVVANLSDCYSYIEYAEEAMKEELRDCNAK